MVLIKKCFLLFPCLENSPFAQQLTIAAGELLYFSFWGPDEIFLPFTGNWPEGSTVSQGTALKQSLKCGSRRNTPIRQKHGICIKWLEKTSSDATGCKHSLPETAYHLLHHS